MTVLRITPPLFDPPPLNPASDASPHALYHHFASQSDPISQPRLRALPIMVAFENWTQNPVWEPPTPAIDPNLIIDGGTI